MPSILLIFPLFSGGEWRNYKPGSFGAALQETAASEWVGLHQWHSGHWHQPLWVSQPLLSCLFSSCKIFIPQKLMSRSTVFPLWTIISWPVFMPFFLIMLWFLYGSSEGDSNNNSMEKEVVVSQFRSQESSSTSGVIACPLVWSQKPHVKGIFNNCLPEYNINTSHSISIFMIFLVNLCFIYLCNLFSVSALLFTDKEKLCISYDF